MLDVVHRLCDAVAPNGHLLVVGHAPPTGTAIPVDDPRRKAMFTAEQLLPGLPGNFQTVVVEQRPRTVTRDGKIIAIDDSTLLARRL